MPSDLFTYQVDLLTPDGVQLGRRPVKPDWGPFLDFSRLEAVRLGRVNEGEVPGSIVVSPKWSETHGRPQVDGFQLVFGEGAGEGFSASVGLDYLSGEIRAAATDLVKEEKLQPGESYRYRIFALAVDENAAGRRAPEGPLEESPIAFGLTERPLTDLAPELLDGEAGADRAGALTGLPVDPIGNEYPVFFPARLIREAEELTEAAGGKETGGILVGKLFRDSERSVIFAEVTAQIPARHVEADEASLAFNPATWSHARSALRLRKRGEILIGWFHSHPVKEWCKKCPAEKRKKCPLVVDFFSGQDRHLHRTAFPGAHSIALVVNQLAADHQTISLFGWSRGVLVQRGFRVLENPDGESETAVSQDSASMQEEK